MQFISRGLTIYIVTSYVCYVFGYLDYLNNDFFVVLSLINVILILHIIAEEIKNENNKDK